MYEWSLVAEGGAVSEICVSNRLSGKKKNNNNNNNKDSTEIRKTIKDSNVLESFNYKKCSFLHTLLALLCELFHCHILTFCCIDKVTRWEAYDTTERKKG